MGQNTSNSVWKPCEDLQKTFDLCHCQQRVYNKVLRWNFVIDQIIIFHHNLQINSWKILQCDFLDFFSYFVSHSWGIPMMKITGLSHLFKWENLHNWWLTKYFFAPLYVCVLCRAGRYTGSYRIPVFIFLTIWIFKIPQYRCHLNNVWNATPLERGLFSLLHFGEDTAVCVTKRESSETEALVECDER